MPVRERRDAHLQPIRLSPFQVSCLRWVAEGKTMKEAAMIDGISVSTVAFHLSTARLALGATTIAQAVAVATRLRLI